MSRLVRLWRPDPAEELEAELSFHLEQLIAEGRARGLSESGARAEAEARLGDLDQVRAQCSRIDSRRAGRERRSLRLGELRQDLGLALRQLANRPGFTAGVVLTLALGLGANSALFGALDALVLRPLRGIGAPGELVQDAGNVSLPALRDFRAQSRTLEIDGFSARTFALDASDTAQGEIVTGGYFDLLRTRPLLGRLLSSEDDLPGAPLAAVLSHRFWLKQFAADRAIVGKTVRLNGASATIVGVAAPGFRGTQLQRPPDLWVPTADFTRLAPSAVDSLDPEQRTWGWLTVLGRLRPGASLAGAQAELNGLAAQMLSLQPDQLHYSIRLLPATMAATGLDPKAVALFAKVLAGVALFVLLLACANVANLQLARVTARRREIAVRLALGATRPRILRQLLTEALVLSVLGGAAGFLLATLATAGFSSVRLPDGATLPAFGLAQNGRALAFTAGLSLFATLLFGLPAGLQATRLELVDSLKEAGADGRARSRLRDLLLVAQVSLSLVLLVGAGLFLRGLQRGLAVDAGFRPGHLAFATVDVSLVHHGAAQAAIEYREIARAVAALPGVREAAWASTLPLSQGEDISVAHPEGYQPRPDEEMWVETQVVSDRYLETMGLQVLSGRGLAAHEPQPVMLVTRAAERRFFPAGAVGKHITFGREGHATEIVGVVADARYHGLEDEPRALAYLPLERDMRLDALTLLARTDGDPATLSRTLRATIESAAPGVPVLAVGTLDDQLRDLLAPQRFGLFFLSAFAGLGLLLAFVGTASVTAFTLGQRKHELGIRMALGADGGRLLRMVLAQTLRLIATGVVVGALIAIAGARILTGLLYGLSPTDPGTLTAAAAVLLAAGLLAALLPARQVLHVDPMISLRSE
jgi:putative ABC transport system permease protein